MTNLTNITNWHFVVNYSCKHHICKQWNIYSTHVHIPLNFSVNVVALPFCCKSIHHVTVEAEEQSDTPFSAFQRSQQESDYKPQSARSYSKTVPSECSEPFVLCSVSVIARRCVLIKERIFRLLKEMLGFIGAFTDFKLTTEHFQSLTQSYGCAAVILLHIISGPWLSKVFTCSTNTSCIYYVIVNVTDMKYDYYHIVVNQNRS